MPAVHSVITFRRPVETAALNDGLRSVDALHGEATDGAAIGEGYLDRFAVGEDVAVSLVSPTGISARVHAHAIAGLIEAAGEVATVKATQRHDLQANGLDVGPVGKRMMARVQNWGQAIEIGIDQEPGANIHRQSAPKP